MKQKDSVMKSLESYNDVFADIVNVTMFGGKHVVRTNALSDEMPYSYFKTKKAIQTADKDEGNDIGGMGNSADKTSLKTATNEIHGQERDVFKFWHKGKIRLCLIGLENQTSTEPLMPLRIMSYDAANYMRQFLEKSKIRCYPVVTLVLYFGTKHMWKKNLSLKEVVHFPQELEPFVNDYRINVVNLAWLTDEQIKAFRSDFREIVVFLRCQRTGEPFRGSRRKLRHAFETIDLIRVMSNDQQPFFEIEAQFARMMGTEEQGDVNMYNALQWVIDEGFNKGLSQGLSKGLQDGKKQGLNDGRIQGAAIATDNITALFSKLRSSGRDDDLDRALSDRAYLDKLLAENQK